MTSNADREIPIACSLSMSDLTDREAAWHRLLGTSLLARERVAGGLRLTVSADAAQELHALVELERNCCPWITFAMDAASVTMTAAGEGADVLVQMFTSEIPADSAQGSVHRDDDPQARYELVKLHIEEAQKEAQREALARRAPSTMWRPLLNAAARLSALARRTPLAAARCDQAYCAAGC